MKQFLLFAAAAVLFLACVATLMPLDRPVTGDERFYLPIIRDQFSGPLTLDLLRGYKSVISPLPFWLYAKVGNVVGFELWKLRAVSLALTLAAALVFYAAVLRATRRPWVAFAAAAVMLTTPYMVRMSAVVYTDMLPLVFLAGWLWFVARGWSWPAAACVGGMLLSRQYYAFVPLAAGMFYFGRAAFRPESRASSLAAVGALALAAAPFALLVLLWGGIAPERGRAWIPADEPLWHPGFLTTYVVATAVYAAPLLLWRWRAIYGSRRTWAVTAPLAVWGLVFPVGLSWVCRDSEAAGMFHRFVQILSGGHLWLERAMLFGVFALGVPVLLWLVKDAWRRARAKEFDLPLLLDLSLLAFYLLMPFSFNVWEKYLLPALMLLCLRLAIGEVTPPRSEASASARASAPPA